MPAQLMHRTRTPGSTQRQLGPEFHSSSCNQSASQHRARKAFQVAQTRAASQSPVDSALEAHWALLEEYSRLEARSSHSHLVDSPAKRAALRTAVLVSLPVAGSAPHGLLGRGRCPMVELHAGSSKSSVALGGVGPGRAALLTPHGHRVVRRAACSAGFAGLDASTRPALCDAIVPGAMGASHLRREHMSAP